MSKPECVCDDKDSAWNLCNLTPPNNPCAYCSKGEIGGIDMACVAPPDNGKWPESNDWNPPFVFTPGTSVSPSRTCLEYDYGDPPDYDGPVTCKIKAQFDNLSADTDNTCNIKTGQCLWEEAKQPDGTVGYPFWTNSGEQWKPGDYRPSSCDGWKSNDGLYHNGDGKLYAYKKDANIKNPCLPQTRTCKLHTEKDFDPYLNTATSFHCLQYAPQGAAASDSGTGGVPALYYCPPGMVICPGVGNVASYPEADKATEIPVPGGYKKNPGVLYDYQDPTHLDKLRATKDAECSVEGGCGWDEGKLYRDYPKGYTISDETQNCGLQCDPTDNNSCKSRTITHKGNKFGPKSGTAPAKQTVTLQGPCKTCRSDGYCVNPTNPDPPAIVKYRCSKLGGCEPDPNDNGLSLAECKKKVAAGGCKPGSPPDSPPVPTPTAPTAVSSTWGWVLFIFGVVSVLYGILFAKSKNLVIGSVIFGIILLVVGILLLKL